MDNKAATYAFLRDLEEGLNLSLPGPQEMRSKIRKLVSEAKTTKKSPHMQQPEDAFLYGYAVPYIYAAMQAMPGVSSEAAKQGFLSEYFRNLSICSGTPARSERHPFNKQIGSKPTTIMEQWKGRTGNPLRQSCPDFAFRTPFPYKVVFEGKYFTAGGRAAAERALVENAYQAFFYRALPKIEPSEKVTGWDYDYACLLAYDASEEGSLRAAWGKLEPKVKRGFWEGANVYMMILRGTI